MSNTINMIYFPIKCVGDSLIELTIASQTLPGRQSESVNYRPTYDSRSTGWRMVSALQHRKAIAS